MFVLSQEKPCGHGNLLEVKEPAPVFGVGSQVVAREGEDEGVHVEQLPHLIDGVHLDGRVLLHVVRVVRRDVALRKTHKEISPSFMYLTSETVWSYIKSLSLSE